MSQPFKTFDDLLKAEQQQLREASRTRPTDAPEEVTTQEGVSGEPWAKTMPTDCVGLALSGGGIRSAVFNLGLLEALDQRGVLRLVDYLSTVSGGGYIGGFWTAWRSRADDVRTDSVFPHRSSTDRREENEPDSRERPETRHLREFSRFLVPRIGLNEPEMWFALATIIGGMLPALLVTLATVALFFYAWLGVGYLALSLDQTGSAALVGLTLGLHVLRRVRWYGENREEFPGTGEWRWALLYWGGALLTTGVGAFFIHVVTPLVSPDLRWGWTSTDAWPAPHFTTLGFEFALAWLASALVTAVSWIFFEGVCRTVESVPVIEIQTQVRRGEISEEETRAPLNVLREKVRGRRLRRGTVRDQQTSRYLSWAVAAATIAAIWQGSFWLSDQATLQGHPVAGTGGLTAVFTGLYVWLRDWLAKPDKQTAKRGVLANLLERGKALLPMASASAGALLFIVFTVLLLRYYGLGMTEAGVRGATFPSASATWRAIGFFALAAGVVVILALKLFDPAYFGLHDFYRSRIARAFLGAAFVSGPCWQRQKESAYTALQECQREAGICAGQAEKAERMAADPNRTEAERAEITKGAATLRARQGLLRDFVRRNGPRFRAKPSSVDNRYTVERPEDDLCLTNLPSTRKELGGLSDKTICLRLRPIHLICCTANHLAGDALSTLNRGGRSAVLSQRGISLGDDTHPPRPQDPELTLSAAQTASAAAFNSLMGEKSLRLGPASSFLMSAFNLRLGLWVMNPTTARGNADWFAYEVICKRRIIARRIARKGWDHPVLAVSQFCWLQLFKLWHTLDRSALFHAFLDLPGRAFFRELFGRASALPEDHARRLHLSDGGHFENLALYELIRRHVRYIIVSDAGQDEEVAFDDLGNAIRRVREDFGVEIEINLAPLRPDEKRMSEQHLVVGTIHYDGFEGSDKGTLLYFKPTLTGDEPGDIQQYRTRNRIFPHEPTTDQFFAEAQWESYRRLGEHVGQASFEFMDLFLPSQRERPETVFRQARAVWSTSPRKFGAELRKIMEKIADFDQKASQGAPPALRAELWPEVTAVARKKQESDPAAVAADLEIVPYLVAALHLMEESWRALRLDSLWSHPSNLAVMNWFRRWWAVPDLRSWWVPLSTVCCNDFREFIKTNFNLVARDPEAQPTDREAPGPALQLRKNAPAADLASGVAWKFWQQRGGKVLPDKTAFEYLLQLEGERRPRPLQVGLAFVELGSDAPGGPPTRARWNGKNFFVPETLSGAGVKSRFLDRLIVELGKSGIQWIEVTLSEDFAYQRDEAARQVRLDLIGFYKSRKFVVSPEIEAGAFAKLLLDLRPGESVS